MINLQVSAREGKAIAACVAAIGLVAHRKQPRDMDAANAISAAVDTYLKMPHSSRVALANRLDEMVRELIRRENRQTQLQS